MQRWRRRPSRRRSTPSRATGRPHVVVPAARARFEPTGEREHAPSSPPRGDAEYDGRSTARRGSHASVTARSRRCHGRGRSSPARDHPRQEAHARQPLADRPPLALAVRRRPPSAPRLQPVLGGPGGGPRGPAPASRRSGSRHHQRRLQRPRLRALGGERPRGGREPEAEPPARAEARRHPRPRIRGLLRPVRPRRVRARAGDLRRAAPRRCPVRRASTGTGRSASSSPTGRGVTASTTAERPGSSPWP